MRVEFKENEVFTYDAENFVVGVHDPGANYSNTVQIKFANLRQVFHFKEMLELILEKG